MKIKILFLAVIFTVLSAGQAIPQWINLNSPAERVTGITSADTNLMIAAAYQGVFLSTDNGISWTQRNNGIDSLFIFKITSSGNNVFISSTGTNPKIFRSSDLGVSWTVLSGGAPLTYATALYATGSYVYAGTNGSLYYSANSGANWISANWTGKTPAVFLKSGGTLFAGTSAHGIFKSTDNGINWTACNSGLSTFSIRALELLGNDLFAGTYYGGAVYKSTDNGNTWTEANSGIQHLQIATLASYGSADIFAAANDYTGCIYHSTNSGQNWITKNQGFGSAVLRFECLYFADGYVYAGTYSDNIWRRSALEIIGIQNIGSEIPAGYVLHQNYPNPFNPSTRIRFEVPKSGLVKISVFDVTGREVAVLVNETLQAGVYETTFDASRSGQGGLTSGVYFCRMEAGGFSKTKTMVLLK